MLKLDTRPAPNPTVVGRVVEGEAVLVLPQQGEVKVLNEVGARIWELIDGSRTIREIVDIICDEYAVEEEQAESDTLAFIAELESKSIISSY